MRSPPDQPIARAPAPAVDEGAPIADEPLGVGAADPADGRHRQVDPSRGGGAFDDAVLHRSHHPATSAERGWSKKVR